MNNRILGLHHITAIAGNAQRNYDFYTRVLGLRLVKKTVNFDDPGTYHFYFGNEVGSPGTILTFFPWEGIKKGRAGTGMATEIRYAVPSGSLAFWKDRFEQLQVPHGEIRTLFGEEQLPFQDPDGLNITLVASLKDDRIAWTNSGIKLEYAIKGFHSVELNLRNINATAAILTGIFGYTFQSKDGSHSRYVTDAVPTANVIDLLESPNGAPGVNAGGTNHHIAFRVRDENVLMDFREKVVDSGLQITEKIDRNYFYSLYFREPGGVLFEIATDNPGFDIDEQVSELGSNLKLPSQYEVHRKEIEQVLPVLN